MRTLLCIVLATAAIPAQTVFSCDFENGLPAEINAGAATITGVQGYAGLGPTGNQFAGSFLRSETGNTVTLTLSNLPPHNVLHLDFLFAAIDSLDGAGAYPQGDYFRIDVDSQTVFREAFANALPSQTQTYVSQPGVELARHVDLGFSGPGSFYTDSAYYLGGDPFFGSIAHSASTLTVAFVIEGPGIQPLNDESWGIDNLEVHLGSGAIGTAAAYGTSCGPTLGATSQPAIGQNLGLALTTLPANSVLAFAAVGVSSAQFGPYVLPLPLGSQGMPGCWLVMDASLLSALPFTLAGGVANTTIPVPNDVGFVGFQIFAQGWVIVPGSNNVGVVFSNGLRIRIGT